MRNYSILFRSTFRPQTSLAHKRSKVKMKYVLICAVTLMASVLSYPTNSLINYPFKFVTRQQWGARNPVSVTQLNTPVPNVIIHHTYIPEVCMTEAACMQAMRSIQNTHQLTNGWVDIGYNFAVGGDGAVYEGRGWNRVGAHATGWNSNSIGIVLIGNWVSNLPPAQQRQTAQALIEVGVRLGYIRSDYRLLGHRQVVATECPGDRLFREIGTWRNFQSTALDDEV